MGFGLLRTLALGFKDFGLRDFDFVSFEHFDFGHFDFVGMEGFGFGLGQGAGRMGFLDLEIREGGGSGQRPKKTVSGASRPLADSGRLLSGGRNLLRSPL